MKKRILAMLLAVAMVLSVTPSFAFAIEGGNTENSAYETLMAAIDAAAEGTTVALTEDVAIAEENAITVSKEITIDLSGYAITAEGDAFVAEENAALTITGNGTVKGGNAGVGSWTAVWANGGAVVINGGTYSVGGDTTEGTDQTHQNDVIYTKNGGEAVINGGTFLNDGNVWTLNENDSNRGTITVYGGTFYNWNPANNVSEGANTNFVADGYKSVENNGVWTVSAKNYVAQVGDQKYETLQEAVIAAKDGGTVKMISDVNAAMEVDAGSNRLAMIYVASGYDVTFDLNGHTITSVSNNSAKDHLLVYVSSGKLTIVDTVGTGKIELSATASKSLSNVLTNYSGTLIVNGGTFINQVSDDFNTFAVDSRDTHGGVYTEINGGTFTVTGSYAMRQCKSDPNFTNDFVIHGGTFNGDMCLWLQNAYGDATKKFDTILVITGGTFNGGANYRDVFIGGTDNWVDTSVAILGGNFAYGVRLGNGVDDDLSGFISGGTFGLNPSAYLADGYAASYANNVFTVFEKLAEPEEEGTPNVPTTDVAVSESKGSSSLTEEDKATTGVTDEKVQEAVTSNTTTSEDLEAAAAAKAETLVTTQEKETAAQNINQIFELDQEEQITADDVSIEIRPYLDVEVTGYETTTQGEETINTLKLNIEALCEVVAVHDTKAVVVDDAKKMDTAGQTITITVPLPETFLNADYVYVKHTKTDGTVYTYKATVDKQAKTATFKNPNGFSNFELYTSRTSLPTNDLAEFVGANLTLGDAIDFSFFIKQADVPASGLTAHIVQDRYTGYEDRTVAIAQAKWENYKNEGVLWRIRLVDVAAKEMCDNITIVIKDAQGNAVSEIYVDSIRDYALRGIQNSQDPNEVAALKAMLRYGAAVQTFKGYDPTNLADAGITD